MTKKKSNWSFPGAKRGGRDTLLMGTMKLVEVTEFLLILC